jgi:DNA-binding transcriptional MerR regulator
MNSIRNVFSIKDLENLSGIKAHTIRIWEKRYNVLEPLRTDTNIRYYDLPQLQKLLNITLLHQYGYKISTISKMPETRIPELVREIASEKNMKNHAISAFKMAMMNFDQTLFLATFENLLQQKSLTDVFTEIVIPLVNEIGLLWQTDTITPAHEHFISNLVKQKLIVNIETNQKNALTKEDKTFVLFLPENEMHELGLLYINYQITLLGYKTIYLGQSIPISNLKDIKKYFSNLIYICYATVEPEKSYINSYIKKLKTEIIDSNTEAWLIGKQCENLNLKNLENIKVFHSIDILMANV